MVLEAGDILPESHIFFLISIIKKNKGFDLQNDSPNPLLEKRIQTTNFFFENFVNTQFFIHHANKNERFSNGKVKMFYNLYIVLILVSRKVYFFLSLFYVVK
jgi:hypothetical protein